MFHSLVNTRYFSEAAIDWKKNGGRYTTAPHGSRDYVQYWEEQNRRCLYGYKVGDLWIPGRYYGYLNFFPMSRVPDAVLMANLKESKDKRGRLSVNTAEKIVAFPSFWEIDYEWWNFKHISWYGGEFMGVESEGGKHMVALKTRGCGFSYKEAWDGIYNYNFIDGSKSYYFAAAENFLIGDAIMDKVQAGLDWINEYSPYWKKNRQKKFTLMHQKASYIDAFGNEKGSMSEIIAQIVDKPSKTRGKRGRKITFEEAGSFPGLEDAVEVAMGSLRDGSVYVGQCSIFGTGGEEGKGIQGLENIHSNPSAWDMLAFPNIWEKGMEGTECGYFVPCYRANSWFMDEEGNINLPAAIEADNKERAKKRKTGKPKDLDRRKAEYPRTPAEALQRINGNGFNIQEIDAQIRKIQGSPAIQSMLRYGRMKSCDVSVSPSGVEFQVMTKDRARPLEDYPHQEKDDLRGCVTVLQKPWVDQLGKTPKGMYFGSFDAYYKEDSEDTTSLFSAKIWKQENSWDNSYNRLPVAWYAGRPQRLDEVFENFFGLLRWYNAMGQGEIAGGGQGVVTYGKTHHLLHWLENEPEMIHNKEIASKSAGNSFLMNMSTDRKKLGITYLEDWHVEPRGIDEHGNIILNIHHIYDLAFLKEMRKHNPLKGNFDRISDAIIGMYSLKERTAQKSRERRKRKGFLSGNQGLFQEGSGTLLGVTSAY